MPAFNFFGNKFNWKKIVRNMILGGKLFCLRIKSLKISFRKTLLLYNKKNRIAPAFVEILLF
jgi:hypothetical protein